MKNEMKQHLIELNQTEVTWCRNKGCLQSEKRALEILITLIPETGLLREVIEDHYYEVCWLNRLFGEALNDEQNQKRVGDFDLHFSYNLDQFISWQKSLLSVITTVFNGEKSRHTYEEYYFDASLVFYLIQSLTDFINDKIFNMNIEQKLKTA